MGNWRFLIDWIPVLILLGLMIFVLRRTGFGKRQADYMAKHTEYLAFMQRYCTDHLDETRRMRDSLHRIAVALSARPVRSRYCFSRRGPLSQVSMQPVRPQ